ncbi:MAG: impB/mucB/samB family protein, partial [Hyphomicrobiaceae bacterium]|nr:impB/mucB/samB family protein [Hyphomicrobiaceae bacterium]
SMTDSTSAIAVSYEAKAYGVKTGTKIYDAKKMCPDLICVLARHDVYVAYHERIFDEIERYLPVEKRCSIDEGACRLMTNEREPYQAVAIARQIKQGLADNIGPAIRCSIGIAQNMFLAKVASDMQKPDGLIVLPPNDYKDQLFAMDLRDLSGIGANIQRRLNSAGINTVEQLWHTEPKHLRKIWGSVAGEVFWYRLHGHDIADKPTRKRVVGHSRVLDPALRQSDKAHLIAQQLTVKACARLRRYNLYARRFAVSVRTLGHQRSRGLKWVNETSFSASQDNFIVLKALTRLWGQMQQDTLKAPLLKVSVTLYDLYQPQDTTLDLFDSSERSHRKDHDIRLSRAMDVLNKRFGAQTVTLGLYPKTAAGYVGTKIAFSRVPEQDEFLE